MLYFYFSFWQIEKDENSHSGSTIENNLKVSPKNESPSIKTPNLPKKRRKLRYDIYQLLLYLSNI